MGVRAERRAAAREGILAAAHRQLSEAGCASASMAVVAARAGVATGSLYRHFPSRGDLLAAVVGDALEGEQALLEQAVAAAASPSAALEAWAATGLARARQAPVLTRALLSEPTGPEVEAVRAAARRHQEDHLGGVLREGAAAGAWPEGPWALQARAIVGALRAVAATDGRAPADATAGHDAHDLVAFVRGAIGG